MLYMSRPGCVSLVSKCDTTHNWRGAKPAFHGRHEVAAQMGLLGGQRGNSSVHKITADREAC